MLKKTTPDENKKRALLTWKCYSQVGACDVSKNQTSLLKDLPVVITIMIMIQLLFNLNDHFPELLINKKNESKNEQQLPETKTNARGSDKFGKWREQKTKNQKFKIKKTEKAWESQKTKKQKQEQ